MPATDETLYLIWFDAAAGRDTGPEHGRADGRQIGVAGGDPAVRRLDDGLYLVRTGRSRSELYHDVKRRTRPRKLLVAPLAAAPKFKGMAEGALKWVRALDF